jgi:hypothetical protein
MAITSGISLLCTDGYKAGLKNLWLIDKADLISCTLTSGSTSDYDTITLGTSKKWYEFEFEEDLAELRVTVEGERGSYKVTQEIEFFVKGLSGTKMAAMDQLLDSSPCGMYAVCEDNNSVFWIIGYNETFTGGERPVRLASTNITTMKALGEVSGGTIVLRCITTEFPYTVTAEIVVT